MDPRYSAQDILLCDLCQRAALQSHCELCQINMCKACVGEHLSDSSKRHNVVPYKHRTSAPNYPKCPNHTQKNCEMYCEKCDIPVCSTCIFSGKHKGHDISDALQKLNLKTKELENDLRELEKRIYPAYEEIALDLNSEKENLEKHYEKLTTAVTKQGEDWHREINIIVNKRKSEIDEMKTEHLAALNKQENEIKQKIPELKQSILDLKKMLDSNDDSPSAYKSRNAEFRSVPPKLNVSLPNFCPHQINTEQLHQMFGSLSTLSITTEHHGYTVAETPEDVSCPPVKPVLDEPEVITTIDTGYKVFSVSCLSDEEIWTCGVDKVMKLYNLQGKVLTSIKTKSGKEPRDIVVTRSEDLVYTDPGTSTVNIVKNTQIQEVIRLQGWVPYGVCSTSFGDLLVTMLSYDGIQSRVVRYSGLTEKQSIQFDSKFKPLYSSGYYSKYISENRNLDICVADYSARAVVVVNQAGRLRFRYTGPPSTTKGTFCPLGITTDSQSQILTADSVNHCIHILDQDGQFLRYVDNCDLHGPWGLCVDIRDNLFVAERDRRKVKKIKYM